MLQIIGWLGCAYLIVKALEISSSNAFRDADGKIHPLSLWAIIWAILAAAGFAVVIHYQGSELSKLAQQEEPLTATDIEQIEKEIRDYKPNAGADGCEDSNSC